MKLHPVARVFVKDIRPQHVIVLQKGERLTVTGQIEEHPVRFLVDSGAIFTLVSSWDYSKLSVSSFQTVNCILYQANGEPMSTKGQMMCVTKLGPLKVYQDVVVTDLQDVILGIDFLLEIDSRYITDTGSFCKVTMTEDGLISNNMKLS